MTVVGNGERPVAAIRPDGAGRTRLSDRGRQPRCEPRCLSAKAPAIRLHGGSSRQTVPVHCRRTCPPDRGSRAPGRASPGSPKPAAVRRPATLKFKRWRPMVRPIRAGSGPAGGSVRSIPRCRKFSRPGTRPSPPGDDEQAASVKAESDGDHSRDPNKEPTSPPRGTTKSAAERTCALSVRISLRLTNTFSLPTPYVPVRTAA